VGVGEIRLGNAVALQFWPPVGDPPSFPPRQRPEHGFYDQDELVRSDFLPIDRPIDHQSPVPTITVEVPGSPDVAPAIYDRCYD